MGQRWGKGVVRSHFWATVAVLVGVAAAAPVSASALPPNSPAPVLSATASPRHAASPGPIASPGHSPIPAFSSANAVACPRPSLCLAAGSYLRAGLVRTLTVLWNGSAWSVIPSPMPKGAVSSVLNSISCGSASSCIAVGSSTDRTSLTRSRAGHWNGWTWAVLPSPTLPGTFAALSGVSCSSASSCLAVGSYTNSRSVSVTLAEFWNGTSWSVLHSPNPAGAQSSALSTVSCRPGTGCMAVGYTVNSDSVAVTLAEHWDGSTWSTPTIPNAGGAQGSFLNGISCWSASACQAVGTYLNSDFASVPLAESWDGHRWALRASPMPAGSPSTALYAVSCSAGTCLAVGHSYSASFAAKDETLAERWDGSRWSIVPSPSPSTTSALYGVSCADSANCLAVGLFFNSASNYQTLAESWDGSRLSVVNQDAELAGVSCVDARHCVSVGSYFSRRSVSVTLAEFWNGITRWAVPTPNPGRSQGSYLTAVNCLSAHRCVAVGYYYDLDNTRETLVESWNGLRWRIVPSPNEPGAAYSVLYGVSCAGLSRCMAVGSAAGRVLAESWDGSRWTVLPTPDPATTAYAELTGVNCSSAAHCLAVGYETDTYYHADVTLSEEWTNGAWSSVPSAAPGKNRSLASVLHAMSCSRTGCLAVGYRQTRSGPYTTLTERWTGRAWSVLASPSPNGSPYSELSGISCSTTGHCLAVGTAFRSGAFVPLAERWSTATWRITPRPPSPERPLGIGYLQGVSCASSSECLAVGSSGDPANLRPLSAAWNGSAWSGS